MSTAAPSGSAGSETRQRGVVKWFSDEKGYGFIQPAKGEDVFVHFSGILQKGHKKLDEGQEVEFDVGVGEKGKFAMNVRVIES